MSAPLPITYVDGATGKKIDPPPARRRRFGKGFYSNHSELLRTTRPFIPQAPAKTKETPNADPGANFFRPLPQVAIDNCKSKPHPRD